MAISARALSMSPRDAETRRISNILKHFGLQALMDRRLQCQKDSRPAHPCKLEMSALAVPFGGQSDDGDSKNQKSLLKVAKLRGCNDGAETATRASATQTPRESSPPIQTLSIPCPCFPQSPRPLLLVRIFAAGLSTQHQLHITAEVPSGVPECWWPAIVGHSGSGVVVETSPSCSHFQVKDEVWFRQCHLQEMVQGTLRWRREGTAADYALVDEAMLAIKPASFSFEQAAAAPFDVLLALQMLREAGVQPHHKVLITWGGATACYAVQLAKHVFNASTVAVMADSGDADLARELGADVIWSQDSDLDEFDIGFDCDNKALEMLSEYGTIKAGGLVVACAVDETADDTEFKCTDRGGFAMSRTEAAAVAGVNFRLVRLQLGGKELDELSQWAAENRWSPVLDGVYPMQRAREAFKRCCSGETQGTVVIRVAPIYYHDGAQSPQILSPRSISNKEERLVRELVASSTYESGCLKPIATTTHTAETLRELLTKLKALSGYDLSPTFTTTKQEEVLVRELVANSTSRSGSTEPKASSSHTPDTLKRLLSRLKALCEYDAVPITPIKSRRRKWLQRHIKWKKSSVQLVDRYEALAHRKAARLRKDIGVKNEESEDTAPPTQSTAPAAATVADITSQSFEGFIGTSNPLHHGPLAVRMYNKRTFSQQYITLSSDAIRCFHIGNAEETGAPSHSDVPLTVNSVVKWVSLTGHEILVRSNKKHRSGNFIKLRADTPENAARWKEEISGAIDTLIREAGTHSKGGFVYGDPQLRLLRTLSNLRDGGRPEGFPSSHDENGPKTALTDVEMTLVRAAGRTVFLDLRESVWQYLALTQERLDTDGMHPCIPKDVLKRVVVMLEQHEKPKDVMAALKLEVNNKIMSLCKHWLTSLMESVKGNRHDSKHRRRIVLTLTSADYGNQDEILRDFCRNISTDGAVKLCCNAKLSGISVPRHGGDMRKEALLACQASFFQKLHEIVPDLPTQVAGAVLRLVTVNPATKALEQLDLLKTYMQLRFVILLSHERAHVITYGYVAKDLKGLEKRRSQKGLSSRQCTDLVMKVCSDNLFVHNGDSTPVVVILQSTSARFIDKVIEDDLTIMQTANESVFFEKFDL